MHVFPRMACPFYSQYRFPCVNRERAPKRGVQGAEVTAASKAVRYLTAGGAPTTTITVESPDLATQPTNQH